MGTALFLGHANTKMRGGPAIFKSVYEAWPGKKCMVFESHYINMIKKLIPYLFNGEINLIIMENEYFTDIFIALLIKVFRRKMRLYGPAYHMPPRSKSSKEFIQYLPHYLDYKLGIWFMSFIYTKIYTENLYMKNYLKSLNSKVDVIVESPGIKCKFIKPISYIHSITKDIDFLFLTSFTANKGLYDYLHLVAALSKKFEYARFAMGGFADQSTIAEINDFITSNNIKNLEIKTNLSEEDKYRLFARAKIYVLPSQEDGIPITFYEAWGYGDVVVAYLLDTYSDIQDYVLSVEVGNFNQLLEKCTFALLNYESLKKKFADKCYYYAKDHSYENGIQNLLENITEINIK